MREGIRALAALAVAGLLAIAVVPANAQPGGTPTSAQAGGGGVRAIPSSIDVQDGLKGSEVFRSIRLASRGEPPQTFRLAIEGDVAPWVTFVDPNDRERPLDVVIDEGEGVTALVRISVPDNASVGLSEGLITAVLDAPADGGEGSPVGLGLAIPVRVNVTGDQVLAGEFLTINVETTEIGLPVRGTATVSNSGNVTVVPEVTLEILQGTSDVYRTSLTGSALFPDETNEFEAVWDTTNALEGEYRAVMSVSFDGLDLGTQEATFELLAGGSLVREVVFTSLELVNEPIAGGLARFEATTLNPSKAEITATFVGELLRNGEIVEQFRSLEWTVRPDETAVVPITLDVPGEGDYTFSGYFAFEGGQTETQQVTFVAGGAGEAAATESNESDSGSILPWIIAGLLGLVVLALLVMLLSRRARKSPSSAGTTAAGPTEAPAGESAR